MTSGCGTTPATKAAQAENIVIKTVNDVVRVIVPMINAGRLTQAQCDKFKVLYNDYYNAQLIAKAVIEKVNASGPSASQQDLVDAQNAVAGAESALINFANQILAQFNVKL